MMEVINISLWPLLFVSLFSLSPAGPTGRVRDTPEEDIRHGVNSYGPHLALNNHINRVQKHNTDGEEHLPKIRHAAQHFDAKIEYEQELSKAIESEIWSKIEHRVLKHVKQSEDNLMDHVQDTASKLNNSIMVNYLYKVYHYLIEEVEVGKQIGEMRAGEIEKVRKIAIEQGKDIVKLKSDVTDLSQTVQNLTKIMDILRAHPGSEYNPGQNDEVATSNPEERPVPVVKPQFPADCHEIYQLGGMKYEGEYFMKIQPYLSDQSFEACCKMSQNAGWTVIQRRVDGDIDFYRSWDSYKRGFGDVRGEFWLGNDRIYELTNQGDYILRIEMTDFDGRDHHAEYEHFQISNEDHKYTMHVHDFSGNGGDSLTPTWNNHDGQPFSTYDHDNDDRFYDNCAEQFHGAWWFKSCFESHLNGVYYQEGNHADYFKQNGIQWNTVGHHYSLKSVVMMIKPNKNVQHPKEHNDHLSNDIQ